MTPKSAGMAGIPGSSLAALLNHIQPGVTKIYDRADRLTEKRAAVAMIADRIEALVA
jgi:hypothetical protein